MKVIIAGGRDFKDIEMMTAKLDALFINTTDDPITIISGTAVGADRMGELYAALRGYEVERYPAEWGKYGKSAGYKRNEQMAALATHCVVFWDGKSKGSKHMIDIAGNHKLNLRVISYDTKQADWLHPDRRQSKA